jgi:hypothetical protein
MTESNPDAPTTNGTDAAPNLAETRLRGAELNGAEQKSSVDHTEYEKTRNPDAELRLDGEDDSLYSDGLDVGDDTESWAGTDGDAPKGIKG